MFRLEWLWAVWLGGALWGCGHVAPSTTPLSSVPAAPTPSGPQGAHPAASAAAVATQTWRGGAVAAAAGNPGKQSKRALLQRACDLGSALACNDLALLFEDESQQALPLLQRACDLGLTRGCANWGVLSWRVGSSDAERDRALETLVRACDASDAFACNEAGDVQYSLQGTKGDAMLGKAHASYEKGCKLGRTSSCLNDGWMLSRGEGTGRDRARALELFRLVCDQQSYEGCAALGYELTESAQNGADTAEGERWLKLACEHDAAFGCFTLGAGMLGRGDRAAVESGLVLLKRACALGFADGCRYASIVEQRLKGGPAAPAAPANEAEGDEGDEDEDEDEP